MSNDEITEPSHGWWECEQCGTQNAPDVDECLCGVKLADQPDSARPLMTHKQAENLQKLAREGLRPARKDKDRQEKG